MRRIVRPHTKSTERLVGAKRAWKKPLNWDQESGLATAWGDTARVGTERTNKGTENGGAPQIVLVDWEILDSFLNVREQRKGGRNRLSLFLRLGRSYQVSRSRTWCATDLGGPNRKESRECGEDLRLGEPNRKK